MHIRNCFSSIDFFEHIQLGITTLASWIKFQIDKSDIKRFKILKEVSTNLNDSLLARERSNYFSWIVYEQRIGNHYLLFKNLIWPMNIKN